MMPDISISKEIHRKPPVMKYRGYIIYEDNVMRKIELIDNPDGSVSLVADGEPLNIGWSTSIINDLAIHGLDIGKEVLSLIPQLVVDLPEDERNEICRLTAERLKIIPSV